MANLFLEGQEADGLLDAAEGDVEGVEIFGLAEEAIEADLQEVQLVQEGGLMGLMVAVRPTMFCGGENHQPKITPFWMRTIYLDCFRSVMSWINPS